MRQQQSDCDSADGDMCSTRSWPDGQGLTNWLLPLTALVDSSTGTWDKGRWRWWWHALWQKDRMGNMTDCRRKLIGTEIMKFKSSEIFRFLDIHSMESTFWEKIFDITHRTSISSRHQHFMIKLKFGGAVHTIIHIPKNPSFSAQTKIFLFFVNCEEPPMSLETQIVLIWSRIDFKANWMTKKCIFWTEQKNGQKISL